MTRNERKELVRVASMSGYDRDQEVARAELRMSHNSARYAPKNPTLQFAAAPWRHELETCKCARCIELRKPGKGKSAD